VSWTGDLLFAVSAVFAIGGAVGTISLRSPLRAAMALLVTIIAICGIFLTLQAQLLAALQLLVYAGAIVVLFVFVIMLFGPGAYHAASDRGLLVRTGAFAMASIGMFGMAALLVSHTAPWVAIAQCETGAECGQFGGVAGLGGAIYTQGMVPFELVSITLLVAVIGAIAVAGGRTSQEIEEARVRRKLQLAEEARLREEAERLSAEVSAHGGH